MNKININRIICLALNVWFIAECNDMVISRVSLFKNSTIDDDTIT